MIQILNKQDCCGCSACVQRCPKQCISMKEDDEGFIYPQVDASLCVDCGLCEKVCPVINQNESREPLMVFAALNPNEKIRLESSSGGVFTMLAELIVEKGGVVFGVKFNEHWEAVHSYTETKDGIAAFRMSKYIQSVVGDTYKEARSFLRQGRQVLYTGTPCQIAGLKRFLGKEYDNLLTLDFICHGTPSPGVFRWYLSEQIPMLVKSKMNVFNDIPSVPKVDLIADSCGIDIHDIRFRDKIKGWKNFSFVLDFSIKGKESKRKKCLYSKVYSDNAFMRGFLRNLYLRPSCYDCSSRNLKSGSDITIGDYWGIQVLKPEIDDDKGISVMVASTKKGLEVIQEMKVHAYIMNYNDLCRCNSSIISSPKIPKERLQFYNIDNLSFFQKIAVLCKIPFKTKLKNRIHSLINIFLNDNMKRVLKKALKR